MKLKWDVALLVLFCLMNSIEIFAQKDSINLQFFGIKKGEKYKIVYKDIEIAKIKCRQKTCIDYVKIPLDEVKKNDIINLHVFRKGKFGIFYRYTELFISYKPGFKYLSFYRNYRLKNRYALDYFWSNGRVNSE